MSGTVKNKQWKHVLKEKLMTVQRKKYDKRLEKGTVTYDAWIRKIEELIRKQVQENNAEELKIKRVPYEACGDYIMQNDFAKEEADVILFLESDGEEAELAEDLIINFLCTHPKIHIVYGDEDVISPEKIRYTPWLKPDWSPDTFLSGFYFGSIFAVRTCALKELSQHKIKEIFKETHRDKRADVYHLCYELARKNGGFKKRALAEEFPVGHIDEILFHSFFNKEMELLYNKGIFYAEEEKKEKKDVFVSVIIPSKDNEIVLKRCIDSIKTTVKIPYEIIVVDNGSSQQTKDNLSVYLKEERGTYLYTKMPFHFSNMCNMGAAAATGEVLLFLNDDVEIPASYRQHKDAGQGADEPREDWMEQVYNQAVRPYTGAVGVKLLYPESDRIQHAGIVNLRLGPVHKLQFKKDNIDYYFGWNREKRNVIALTGACLGIEREKFLKIGGFCEELPVAFNDVDLCFSIYKNGYYNVVIQSIALYHYESLSRGQDEEKDKLERLILERKKLYERHKDFYAKDPFYHKYFANDILSTGFDLRADYECKNDIVIAACQNNTQFLKDAKEDACVMISLEYAGVLSDWKHGQDEALDFYYIQGYAFVAGSDNACYEKKIILEKTSPEGERELIVIKPEVFIRKDVEENLPDQIHVGMTGFGAKIRKKDIGDGSYRIGVFVKDKCSGQRLFSWTNRYLEAGKKIGGEE